MSLLLNGQSAPVALDDGDWFGGVAGCLVGVAIALGAAASAQGASLQQQMVQERDDFAVFVADAPGNFSGAAWQQRAAGRTTFFSWGGGDDFVPAAAPTVALDDSSALPLAPAAVPPVLRAFDAQDEVPTPAQVALDDGLAPAFVLARDDATIIFWQDGGSGIPAAPPDEEFRWPPPASAAAPVLPTWWPDDDLPAQAAAAALDAGELVPQAPPGLPPFLVAWHDEQTPTLGIALDHGGEWAPSIPAPAAPVLLPVWRDDLPSPKLDDASDWWPWPLSAAAPLPRVFADPGDDLPPQAAGAIVEDEPWITAPGPVPPAVLFPWVDQDAVPAAAAPLGVDDDAQLLPLPPAAAPVLLPLADDGSAPTFAAPAALDADAWLPPAAPAPRPWLIEQWQQDELPRLTVDEEAWQPAPAPAVRPVLLGLQDQDEAPAQPAVALDDGFAWISSPCATPPVLVVWLGEDAVPAPAAPLPVDEAYLWPPLPIMPPTLSLWVADCNEDVPELFAPPTPAPTPATQIAADDDRTIDDDDLIDEDIEIVIALITSGALCRA